MGTVPSLGRPRIAEEGLQPPGWGKPGQECDGVKQRGEVPVRSSPSSPPGAIAGLDGLQELSGNGFVSHLSGREQGEDRMTCGAQPHVSHIDTLIEGCAKHSGWTFLRRAEHPGPIERVQAPGLVRKEPIESGDRPSVAEDEVKGERAADLRVVRVAEGGLIAIASEEFHVGLGVEGDDLPEGRVAQKPRAEQDAQRSVIVAHDEGLMGLTGQSVPGVGTKLMGEPLQQGPVGISGHGLVVLDERQALAALVKGAPFQEAGQPCH